MRNNKGLHFLSCGISLGDFRVTPPQYCLCRGFVFCYFSVFTLRGEEVSEGRRMGVFTLRGVEGEGLMGCGAGGDLVACCRMIEISMYSLEDVSPYMREGRLEDLF